MTQPEFTCSVVVSPLPEQSDAASNQFAFSYTVTIQNTGGVAAQLIARHWFITDSQGHQQEVRGLAVVGHQPFLQPGEQFEYTSWTHISAPSGSMRGSFFCITENAEPFEAPVPEFALALPSALH
ncbi:MAG: Co2+/Mg2+ efflux protein ApaG [Burkholderiales bacterium]|jgi:ApaG protein